MSGGSRSAVRNNAKTRTQRRRVLSRLGSGLGLALAVVLGLRPCPDPNIRFVAREDSILPRPVGTSPQSHSRHDGSFRCFPHKQSKPTPVLRGNRSPTPEWRAPTVAFSRASCLGLPDTSLDTLMLQLALLLLCIDIVLYEQHPAQCPRIQGTGKNLLRGCYGTKWVFTA